MKTILSWFGLYEWVEAGFLVEWQVIRLGIWARPWDEQAKTNFRRGVEALQKAGWEKYY